MELLVKTAIDPQDLPTFFSVWIDRSHKLCIYIVAQTHAQQYNKLQVFSLFLNKFVGFFLLMKRKNSRLLTKCLMLEHISIESQVFSSQTSTKKQRGKISSTPTQPPTNTLKTTIDPLNIQGFWKHPLFPPPTTLCPLVGIECNVS